MMLPLLPFLSAASTALLRPGRLLKLQMLSQNAERHLRKHCSEEDRQHYIATSRYISTVISKAKAKSWQNTCSSLSPKTRPSEVFSLLRSISGSPSPTTSDFPNFPNCHTPVDCANHLSSHLQSHFSTQTSKPFRSTEKAQMKYIRTAHCNTLHSTFCSPFSSLKLSTAISQLSTSTSSGPDQITYPLLSHLPKSALHFLLYIFNLSWSTHTFPLPGNNQQSFPFSNPENPLTHLPHIDPFLSLHVPPNSSKEWF